MLSGIKSSIWSDLYETNNIGIGSKKIFWGGVPLFQVFYRKAQDTSNKLIKLLYKFLFVCARNKNHIEMSIDNQIGPGLYFAHPYCITINPRAVLGRNINLHKGVTIGEEHRGARAGCPILGDNIWVGVNATIVGKIKIGNDVLIASNSFVNCDVPDHSVVFGNPCVIKHRENATENYVNRAI